MGLPVSRMLEEALRIAQWLTVLDMKTDGDTTLFARGNMLL